MASRSDVWVCIPSLIALQCIDRYNLINLVSEIINVQMKEDRICSGMECTVNESVGLEQQVDLSDSTFCHPNIGDMEFTTIYSSVETHRREHQSRNIDS